MRGVGRESAELLERALEPGERLVERLAEEVELDAAQVEGVRRVINLLVVREPALVTTALRISIEVALTRQVIREARRLHLEIHDGRVTVAGSVTGVRTGLMSVTLAMEMVLESFGLLLRVYPTTSALNLKSAPGLPGLSFQWSGSLILMLSRKADTFAAPWTEAVQTSLPSIWVLIIPSISTLGSTPDRVTAKRAAGSEPAFWTLT